jgi:hypothetical protein
MQSLLIAVIVAGAAVYAVWALTPAIVRRRYALKGAALAGGPQASGLRGRLARTLLGLAQTPSSSCGGCSAHQATPAERMQRKG